MPAATFTVNPYPNGVDNSQRFQRIYGTISISSGTYPSGGFAITWAAGSQEVVKSNLPPVIAYFESVAAPPSGYSYTWDATNQKLRVFQNGAINSPQAEISGSIPSGVTGDTIAFELLYLRD